MVGFTYLLECYPSFLKVFRICRIQVEQEKSQNTQSSLTHCSRFYILLTQWYKLHQEIGLCCTLQAMQRVRVHEHVALSDTIQC
jgi:hypothetical protein